MPPRHWILDSKDDRAQAAYMLIVSGVVLAMAAPIGWSEHRAGEDQVALFHLALVVLCLGQIVYGTLKLRSAFSTARNSGTTRR